MKIVYVIDSLASKGGAERIIINKMDYLTKERGYDIHIITCYQSKDTPNAYPISNNIKQIFLGIPFYSQYKYHYPFRLYVKYSLNRKLIQELTNTIQEVNPDILIGLSYFKADVVSGIKCKAKKIIEVHEPRPFTLSDYGLNRGRLSKWYMKHYRNKYFKKVEKQADVIVTLTQGDAYEWREAKQIQVIPNFSNLSVEKISDCTAKRVLAVGRLEWVKGYDRLINAWKIVSDKHPDWHLDIFGTGTMEQNLKQQQLALGLEDKMTIHPATSTINKEYSKSSILALTSHFEGLSLVLLEAMQTGVPCVAFNCPYGPCAIIDDGENGFLVPDGDIMMFANKISELIENRDLIRRFSKAALEKSNHFSVEVIMRQWKDLFRLLVS